MSEGSIGKEGPSAGSAILSAFVSLFTKTRVDLDITTTGRFKREDPHCPSSRYRSHLSTLLLIEWISEGNLQESVKTGIKFVCVNEVLHEAFRGEVV
ncbi:hypothetical protein BYT27DRAFT_6548654 [Phlegmacium glaucopus]|nr:hypothetical protein BYT27DRAFT_6548654 [Phlegmacium glaucopus]